MSNIVKSAIAVAFAVAAMPAAASTVLTFDGSEGTTEPYVEAGFEVDDTGFNIALDGALHIDIAFGPNSNSRIIKRVDGSAFDVHSLDIISLFPSVSAGGLTDSPRDDVEFRGLYEAGGFVSTFASSQFGDMTEIFSDAFKGLSSFIIRGFDAGNVDLDLFRDVHFLIDNIVVSGEADADDPMPNVPVPASGLLLFGALGLGATVGMRRPIAAG